MKKTQYIVQVVLYLFFVSSYAQIGINTPAPDLSAALDITATDKGFLPPRITLKGIKDTITIVKPASGLFIYNIATTTNGQEAVNPGYYFFSGTTWVRIGNTENTWSTQGNSGINASNQFIGTLDDADLVFKRNKINMGFLASENIAFGREALMALTTGRHNVSLGFSTLTKNTTGSFNTAVGSGTLSQNLTSYNTAIGNNALLSLSSGDANTAVGNGAAQNSRNGRMNTSMGHNAYYHGYAGGHNTMLGSYAGFNNHYGNYNTVVGAEAMYYNQHGNYNAVLGKGALYQLKPSAANQGDANVAVGNDAGLNLTKGNQNIFLGAQTIASDPAGDNQLNIGNSIYGVDINKGNTARIGVNTAQPNESAILDLSSTNRGFLPPRIALKGTDDLTTIKTPAQGLLIYNTAQVEKGAFSVSAGYYYFDGLHWVPFRSEQQGWGTRGNSDTDSEQDFMGTIDNQDVVFKRGNIRAGLLSSINTYNTSFGVNTYKGTPKGSYVGRWNTAIGYGALSGNNDGGRVTGHDNTAVGANSLSINDNGRNNTAIGSEVLRSNMTGSDNTALGFQAMNSNRIGEENVAVGRSALIGNSEGSQNTAVGFHALNQNISGKFNTAVGYLSGVENGYGIIYNTTAIGSRAKVYRSNVIRLGDKEITSIYGQVPFGSIADARSMSESQPLELGLNFIEQLEPLEYIRSTNRTRKKEWGVLAQDIQAVLETMGYTNAALIESEGGQEQLLLLRYSELIAPMIKAIQELSAENKQLTRRLEALETQH